MNLRLDVRILCIPKLWCSCSARICNKNSCTIFFWKYMYYSLLITDQCRARRWEQIKTLLGRIQDTLGPIGKCTIRNRLQDNATKTAPRQILSTNSMFRFARLPLWRQMNFIEIAKCWSFKRRKRMFST